MADADIDQFLESADRQIGRINTLLEGVPMLKFPDLPEIDNRPEQQVAQPQTPRQVKIQKKRLRQRLKDVGWDNSAIEDMVGDAARAMSFGGGMQGLTFDQPRGDIIAVIGQGSGKAVRGHEAIHYSLTQIGQVYGPQAQEYVVDELLDVVDQETIQHIKSLVTRISGGRYKFRGGDDLDEILTFMYTFIGSEYFRDKAGVTREQMNAIKRDWKQVIKRARQFTPEELEAEQPEFDEILRQAYERQPSENLFNILDAEGQPDSPFDDDEYAMVRDILRKRGDL